MLELSKSTEEKLEKSKALSKLEEAIQKSKSELKKDATQFLLNAELKGDFTLGGIPLYARRFLNDTVATPYQV